MAVKPASPALQTGHALYTSLTGYWLWLNDYLDQTSNNYDWSVSGGSDITFATPGTDDDPVLDRSNASNANRLTLASGISIGALDTLTVCARVYVRTTPSFGLIVGQGASNGLYTISSGSGFKFRYYSASGVIANSTELSFNTWYNVTYTYNPTGTASAFYVNGSADGTAVVSVATHTINTMLSDTFSERFDGRVAVAAVYKNRLFNSTEAADWSTDPYGVVRAVGGGSGGARRRRLLLRAAA